MIPLCPKIPVFNKILIDQSIITILDYKYAIILTNRLLENAQIHVLYQKSLELPFSLYQFVHINIYPYAQDIVETLGT